MPIVAVLYERPLMGRTEDGLSLLTEHKITRADPDYLVVTCTRANWTHHYHRAARVLQEYRITDWRYNRADYVAFLAQRSSCPS